MRIISPSVHALIDYLVVVFLIAAPFLFGFSPFVATMTWIIAGIHFLLTILTKFPGGFIKVIPLRIHGLIELIVGIALLFSPWIFGFAENAVDKNFYLAFGGAVLLVWILTDYARKKPVA